MNDWVNASSGLSEPDRQTTLQEVIDLLRRRGIHVHPSADEDSFLEDLRTCLHALNGRDDAEEAGSGRGDSFEERPMLMSTLAAPSGPNAELFARGALHGNRMGRPSRSLARDIAERARAASKK
jgi:hypothetical protein